MGQELGAGEILFGRLSAQGAKAGAGAMKKHPPDRKYPPGLEWTLFKKLPLLTGAGFLVLGLIFLAVYLWPWQGSQTEVYQFQQRINFALIGAAIFHLTMMITVAIGCVVVLIMKGPRYSADSYPVQDADRPADSSDSENKKREH